MSRFFKPPKREFLMDFHSSLFYTMTVCQDHRCQVKKYHQSAISQLNLYCTLYSNPSVAIRLLSVRISLKCLPLLQVSYLYSNSIHKKKTTMSMTLHLLQALHHLKNIFNEILELCQREISVNNEHKKM